MPPRRLIFLRFRLKVYIRVVSGTMSRSVPCHSDATDKGRDREDEHNNDMDHDHDHDHDHAHDNEHNEHDNPKHGEARKSWSDAFFDEHNIVNTMQCLLVDTNMTIEDLSALCVAMNNNNVVLSFTHRGLMPIASAHMYIFPYTKMNREQLRVLRSEIAQTKKTFEAVFQEVTYNVHGMPHAKVDSVMILFAANCLLLHGLSTTTLKKNGFIYAKLDKHNVLYHLNATLFTIMNACNMRAGAAHAAARLLRKHGVSTEC
jgi:hypothetical protein